MKLIKQLRNWIFPVSEQQILRQVIDRSYNQGSVSGLLITPEGTLTVTGIWAGVNAIANPMSCMKFPTYKRTKTGKAEDTTHNVYDLLMCRANPEMPALKFRQTLMLHVLIHGNGYAEIVRDVEGYPIELWNIDPNTVQIHRGPRDNLFYRINGRKFLPENILHISQIGFDGVKGYAINQIGREAIAMTKAAELYGSSFFGNGAQPGGFIKTAKKMQPEAKAAFMNEINRDSQGLGNSHRIQLLDPDMDWVLTSVSPETAQLLGMRGFQIEEIARLLNISKTRLGDGPTPTDMEAYNTEFYQTTLHPWAENIEAEFNSKLFSDIERKAGWYCEHNFSSLLRGNQTARADYYTKMYSLGAITTNRIISEDNLGDNIGPAGDYHFIPENNLTPLEQIHKELTTPDVVPVDTTSTATAAAPVGDGTDVPVENIQGTALNGAQIASLLEITGQVVLKQLPIDSAFGLIQAAFPAFSSDQIKTILDPFRNLTAPIAPESTPTPSDDGTVTPQSDVIAGQLRGLVQESIARMVRRECEAVTRLSGKPLGERSAAIDQFYERHKPIVRESIGPSVRAWVSCSGSVEDPEPLIDQITLQLTDDSRAMIDDCQDVAELVASWNSKAKEIVDML